MPVPIAVAPRLISWNSVAVRVRRWTSSSIVVAQAWNSWPTVIGTASCSWVRPIFRTEENSSPLARRVEIRWSIASASAGKDSMIVSRIAVG